MTTGGGGYFSSSPPASEGNDSEFYALATSAANEQPRETQSQQSERSRFRNHFKRLNTIIGVQGIEPECSRRTGAKLQVAHAIAIGNKRGGEIVASSRKPVVDNKLKSLPS